MGVVDFDSVFTKQQQAICPVRLVERQGHISRVRKEHNTEIKTQHRQENIEEAQNDTRNGAPVAFAHADAQVPKHIRRTQGTTVQDPHNPFGEVGGAVATHAVIAGPIIRLAVHHNEGKGTDGNTGQANLPHLEADDPIFVVPTKTNPFFYADDGDHKTPHRHDDVGHVHNISVLPLAERRALDTAAAATVVVHAAVGRVEILWRDPQQMQSRQRDQHIRREVIPSRNTLRT